MKDYNLKSLAVIVLLSSINYAFADNAVLENEYVKAGVNVSTGTLGSGGNTRPGLQFDNTGTHTWPSDSSQGDYLTPGSPFEGFTVRLEDGTGTLIRTYTNNNWDDTGNITGGAWLIPPIASSVIWRATTSDFAIQNTYSLPSGQKYIDIETQITASIAIPKLWFGRFIDPDAMPAEGDTSATDNALGYGAIPKANVVFSEATVSRYALGLYSSASNVNAGITGWTIDPKTYYAGTTPYFKPLLDSSGDVQWTDPVCTNAAWGCPFVKELDSSGNPITLSYGNGDDTIGLGFLVNNVAIGDIVHFQYAYIFGPNAFSAASIAVDGGAGGGNPGDVPGGGTLTDVGSATDSAIDGITLPTVVSTADITITVSDVTIVSGTLPVITASLAHHVPTETTSVQTIARETTTNVTSPMERTLVTKVRTTTTWSDGTTTFVDSANVTDVTVSNSVATTVTNANFSGRIDQQSQLSELNKGLNRGLNADAFRKDMVDGERYRMYMGATYLSSNAGNGYDANSNRVNIGVEADVNDGWIMGLQYNNVTTKLDGVDSYTKQNKNHAGLYSVITINDWIIKSDFGVADNNIKSNRNVEQTFFNASKTNGTDVWLSNRAYMPSINGLRPYAEFTFGNNERNAYIETGSVQSYRSVSKVNDSINFGECGVRYDRTIDKLSLTGEAGVSTDSYKDLKAELSYLINPTSRLSWSYNRQEHKDLVSNSVALYGKINF
jgi:hypothetical protein